MPTSAARPAVSVARVLASGPPRLEAGEPRLRRTTRGSSSRRSASCHWRRHSCCCSVPRRRSSISSPTCRGRRRSRSTTRRCRSRRSRSRAVEGVAFLSRRIHWRDAAGTLRWSCSCARRRDHRVGAVADRRRVPQRRMGTRRVPEFDERARRGAHDPDDAAVSATYNLVPHLTTAPRSTRSRTRGSRRTSASTASPGGAARVEQHATEPSTHNTQHTHHTHNTHTPPHTHTHTHHTQHPTHNIANCFSFSKLALL